MLRILGWLAVGLGALLVLAVLLLLALGGERRLQLRAAIQNVALDLSGAGQGFADGELVWRQSEPWRITVERLPSLDRRRVGTAHSGDLFTERMAWFGISLRELLARCLERHVDLLVADESLDRVWFDVDVARPRIGADSTLTGWEAAHEDILAALLERYELTVQREPGTRRVEVLRPGPGWARHLVDDGELRERGIEIASDGLLRLDRQAVSRLLDMLGQRVGPLVWEGLEPDALCSVELFWQAGDLGSLRRALAEQFDLRMQPESREVELVVVRGVVKESFGEERSPSR